MTYQDWIARGDAVCDAECAEAMGWIRGDSIYSSGKWYDGNGTSVAPTDWSPTTDRNATAMMVEEVKRRGKMATLLIGVMGDNHPVSFLEAVELGICAAPSLIAWACCRALKEEV